MNLKKESDVNFGTLKGLAKQLGLKVGKNDDKHQLMFTVGNKLLKDKVVVLKDESQTICRNNLTVTNREILKCLNNRTSVSTVSSHK